jgi:hypothetical protein
VKITMFGKFLPNKYSGNEPGILESGVKQTPRSANGCGGSAPFFVLV